MPTEEVSLEPFPTAPFTGPKEHDLTGLRVGKLTVIGYSAKRAGQWVAQCDCGWYVRRQTPSLRKGNNACCPYCGVSKEAVEGMEALPRRKSVNARFVDTSRACRSGKKTYLSYTGAQKAITTFKLRSDDYRVAGRSLGVYRCDWCRGLHVGNTEKRKKREAA